MTKSNLTKDPGKPSGRCEEIETRTDVATWIMKRMVRMPPKPHGEMKTGKRRPSDVKSCAEPSPSKPKRREPSV